MKIENLLHQAHRRFVTRARDEERRGDENQARDANQRSEVSTHGSLGRHYSVIRGSNVHSDKVRKTTSKNNNNMIQKRAIATSGGLASKALVPRTPAIMTGIV